MPVMSGYKAAKAIFEVEKQFRSGELGPTVLVAAVTAFVDSTTVADCRKAGMQTVFLKPVSFDKLNKFLKTEYLQVCNQ